MYWNPETGQLSRISDRDEPYLRPLMQVLLDTDGQPTLDNAMHRVLQELAAPRVVP